MHEHGLLAREGLHCVAELDDLVAVDAAHPRVDVPAHKGQGRAGGIALSSGLPRADFNRWGTGRCCCKACSLCGRACSLELLSTHASPPQVAKTPRRYCPPSGMHTH